MADLPSRFSNRMGRGGRPFGLAAPKLAAAEPYATFNPEPSTHWGKSALSVIENKNAVESHGRGD
jgi:hypothetical protein